jgi:drug/metabolite transporter (DMT)-like permease
MAALLALISSIGWGSADFLGGLASRRVGALRTLFISYPAGVVIIIPVALWVIPGQLSVEVFRWGVAAGLIGAVSMVLLYAALARGPMGVVSPLTAVMSAAIPLTVGIVRGETLGALAWLGVGIAVIAVILITRERGRHLRASPAAVILAVGSGVAIGGYLTILGLAPADSGIWAASLGRVVSSALVMGAALLLVRPVLTAGYPWLFAIVAGSMDALANGIFQIAAQQGELGIVAVIASLYPAATVVLARVVLREKMSRVQASGVIAALAAAALLSLT